MPEDPKPDQAPAGDTKPPEEKKITFDNEAQDEGSVDEEPNKDVVKHEVTHNDELTVKDDVTKMTGAQRRLISLALLAAVLIFGGGYFFYQQIEVPDPTDVNSAQGDTTEEDVPSLRNGTFAFVAQAGSNEILEHKRPGTEENAESKTEAIGLESPVSELEAGRNVPIQVSSNGLAIVYQSGSEQVKLIARVEGTEKTILENTSTDDLQDWVLSSDGARVFILKSGDLIEIDMVTGVTSTVAEEYGPEDGELSQLYYCKDGTVRQYGKGETALYSSVFSVLSRELEQEDYNVPRLGKTGSWHPNSLSPDCTFLLLPGTFAGGEGFHLLSLNSYVMKAVYVAEDGIPIDFSWSADSNHVVISIEGEENRLEQLRTGTIERSIISTGGEVYESPRVSPTNDSVMYRQDGKVYIQKIKKIEPVFEEESESETETATDITVDEETGEEVVVSDDGVEIVAETQAEVEIQVISDGDPEFIFDFAEEDMILGWFRNV